MPKTNLVEETDDSSDQEEEEEEQEEEEQEEEEEEEEDLSAPGSDEEGEAAGEVGEDDGDPLRAEVSAAESPVLDGDAEGDEADDFALDFDDDCDPVPVKAEQAKEDAESSTAARQPATAGQPDELLVAYLPLSTVPKDALVAVLVRDDVNRTQEEVARLARSVPQSGGQGVVTPSPPASARTLAISLDDDDYDDDGDGLAVSGPGGMRTLFGQLGTADAPTGKRLLLATPGSPAVPDASSARPSPAAAAADVAAAGGGAAANKQEEVEEEEDVLGTLAAVFGHGSFRGGQAWAIERVLAGQPTLLVAPTGLGKSLTYQLPALLLWRRWTRLHRRRQRAGPPGCLTVVISPLVALMEDQMHRLPPPLVGVCMSSTQSAKETAATLGTLRAGAAHILFVSPERLLAPSFRRLVRNGEALPPVKLVAVDEAHCVCEWGHSFRPAYLKLGDAIRELFDQPTVLALTATATPSVIQQVCMELRIPPVDGVLSGRVERSNLRLSASNEAGDGRHRALAELLTGENSPLGAGAFDEEEQGAIGLAPGKRARRRRLRSPKEQPVVVYAATRYECGAIADYLKAQGISAAAYHADVPRLSRDRTHKRFLTGGLRVVVATIAFGLGVDKADVRGVIHWGIPRSLEDYVQQTGRAGRDGQPAWCHCFLSAQEAQVALRRGASGGLVLSQVQALLGAVVGAAVTTEAAATAMARKAGLASTLWCDEGRQSRLHDNHWVEVSADVNWCAEVLGVRPEDVEGVLCRAERACGGAVLQHRSSHFAEAVVTILGNDVATAKKRWPLLGLASVDPSLSERRGGKPTLVLRIDLAAAAAGWPGGRVRSELWQLQSEGLLSVEWRRWSCGCSVDLSTVADLSPDLQSGVVPPAHPTLKFELQALAQDVAAGIEQQRALALGRVEAVWSALSSVSKPTWAAAVNEAAPQPGIAEGAEAEVPRGASKLISETMGRYFEEQLVGVADEDAAPHPIASPSATAAVFEPPGSIAALLPTARGLIHTLTQGLFGAGGTVSGLLAREPHHSLLRGMRWFAASAAPDAAPEAQVEVAGGGSSGEVEEDDLLVVDREVTDDQLTSLRKAGPTSTAATVASCRGPLSPSEAASRAAKAAGVVSSEALAAAWSEGIPPPRGAVELIGAAAVTPRAAAAYLQGQQTAAFAASEWRHRPLRGSVTTVDPRTLETLIARVWAQQGRA